MRCPLATLRIVALRPQGTFKDALNLLLQFLYWFPLVDSHQTSVYTSLLTGCADRGAWWARVHGVAKSWMRLSMPSSVLLLLVVGSIRIRQCLGGTWMWGMALPSGVPHLRGPGSAVPSEPPGWDSNPCFPAPHRVLSVYIISPHCLN